MAWAVKYSGTFYNIAEQEIQVDISKDDYVGPVFPLRIQSLDITHNWNGYMTPVTGTGLEMTIINEDSDWDFYEELFVCEEQEFKITATITDSKLFLNDYVLFDGFLLTDIQEQEVIQWASINLKASNYLKQLDEVDEMDSLNGAATWPVLQYIGEALQATGLLYNIYVNCSLYEVHMDNERIMTDLYLHKHLFYLGEEEDAELKYKGLSDIINTILKPFNMYVYSFNKRWYIERYADLYDPESGLEYNWTFYDVYNISTLTYVNTVQLNFPILIKNTDGEIRWGAYDYVDTSQTLEYGKGYRKVTVNCKVNKEHNLVNEYFGNALPFDSLADVYTPTTDIERWGYDETGTLSYGEDWVVFHQSSSAKNWTHRGIAQKVLLRGTKRGQITLNISFRRELTPTEYNKVVADSRTFVDTCSHIRVVSFLRVYFMDPSYDSTAWHPHDYFYVTNAAGSYANPRYEMREYNAWTYPVNTGFHILASVDSNGYTPHYAWGYDTEGEYYYWEYNFSLTFDQTMLPQKFLDVGEYAVDIFRNDTVVEVHLDAAKFIYDEKYGLLGLTREVSRNIAAPVYRKIRITTSDEEDDVDIEVEGEVDTNYFDEYSVDVDLFDHTNHAAANAMYINDAFLPTPYQPGVPNPVYSSEWLDSRTELESDRSLNLQEHLLEDMFQLLNKPRKKLKARIRYDYPIKPFSFLQDHNITREGVPINFVIVAYTLDVNNMIYEIEAEEFVTDDNFRLIDGEIVSVPDTESSDAGDSWDSGEYPSDYTYQILTLSNFLFIVTTNQHGELSMISSGYVRYYNTSTLTYRNELIMQYLAPTNPRILLRTNTVMPGVGNNIEDYFIITAGYSTDSLPITVFDSTNPQEVVSCFYLVSGGIWSWEPTYVWKITMIDEIESGGTDFIYQFNMDYAYKGLIEGVNAVGN